MITAPVINWILGSDGTLLHGYDSAAGAFADQDLAIGIGFPLLLTSPVSVSIATTAFQQNNFRLANIQFYLAGDAAVIALLQGWAALTPPAGLQISFDSGVSWTTFSSSAGNPQDASTWIPMPGIAVSSVAADGQLGPLDTAALSLRLQVPASVPEYGLFEIQLGIDCDVW